METQKDNDHYKKQFRRDTGAAKGYKDSIIEDAFKFAGKDISESRPKYYLNNL